MEDVLSVYELPYDPAFPQVCMDEASKQLIGDVAPPTAADVGKPRREDYEYVRNGTSNQFMFCEPLRGWRHVEVTDRRTMQDWAWAVQRLVDVHYPEAEKIRLVLDNLNTHTGASLYATFPPAEAKRILDRLEIHYTPKHASWLNMAEIEIAALSKQCLTRRLSTIDEVQYEASRCSRERNRKKITINWTFHRKDAKRVFPELYRK